ncbi:exonuclease domain-containing protein [Vibrio coralliirubri]|uniref:exonuclease domain-containing protein n=1 Tax=Vibrio coralliirubri TaxID=1516159 RepID=UPI0022850667|nr:exonuclease domain-containing protein [Vibrio coralliirubri]MCY9861089.1 exonuclease domain-containing protein [Vibrio coralliirubri]
MLTKTIRPLSRTLCVDLEFTFGKKNTDRVDIYEIGIVAIDEYGKEVDSFQTHVLPDSFCGNTLEFLSLTEKDFVGAPDLKTALISMNDFVEKQFKSVDRVNWCSWGDRDKQILSNKAGRVSITNGHKLTRSPYFDAQLKFSQRVPRSSYRPSLREAVEDFCGTYIENHHSALDDARALSKVVSRYCY